MLVEKTKKKEPIKVAIIGIITFFISIGIIIGLIILIPKILPEKSILDNLSTPLMFLILLIFFNITYLFLYLIIFNLITFIIIENKPISFLKLNSSHCEYLQMISAIQGLLTAIYFSIVISGYVFKSKNRWILILLFTIIFSFTHYPLYEIYKKYFVKRDDYII